MDEALDALEQMLTSCSEVLRAAASKLDVADVVKALRFIPWQHRRSVLEPLGLTIRPRNVNFATGQHVATRIARANEHDLRHAVSALSLGAWMDISDEAFRGQSDDSVQKWGEALCRVAVWANGLTSVHDARIWFWATEREWFRMDGLSDAQVEKLAAASERVVVATSSYKHGVEAEAVEREDDASLDNPMDDELLPHTDDARAEDALGSSWETADDLMVAVDNFDVAFAGALGAAQRVVKRLGAKQVPLRSDLDVLVRTRESFDDLATALSAAGVVAEDESVAALRTAVEQLTAHESDVAARELLGAVCALRSPDEPPMLLEQLTRAQKEAQELLAADPWDNELRERAESLGVLVGLVSTDSANAERMPLVMMWSSARPELSFLAIQAGLLMAPDGPWDPSQKSDDVKTAEEPPSPDIDCVAELGAASLQGADLPRQAVPEVIEEPVDTVLPEPVHAEVETAAGDTGTASFDTTIEDTLARLVEDRRFGLAAEVLKATGETDVQFTALRIAALSGVVRNQAGAVATLLQDEFDNLEAVAVAGDTPSLLLTVPALIRVALVTGQHATGALLNQLAPHLEPNLNIVAEEIGRRALHGILAEAQTPLVLADVTEVERGIQMITQAAGHIRSRNRTLRFKRATDISKIWLDARGILGRPLSLVERNDSTAVDEVADFVDKLSTSSFIKSELDKLDRRFQGTSGKPIEGAGRQDLLNLVQEALKPLADWVVAVRSLDNREMLDRHWSAGEVAEMRRAVLDRRGGVLGALENLTHHNDPLTAAAARAASHAMITTFNILEGTRKLPAREPSPELVLTVELLKLADATVDHGTECVVAPRETTVQHLLEVVDRSWDQALSGLVGANNFAAAHFLLELAAAGKVPQESGSVEGLVERATAVDRAELEKRTALADELQNLLTTLRRERLNNAISDEQDGELTSLLEDARRNLALDLVSVDGTLRRISDLLPRYRAEATARLTVRLKQLQSSEQIDPGTHERVVRLLDDGQLSTAEELIYFLEIDEDVPAISQSLDLTRFFPAVPNALGEGISHDLVALVGQRGVVADCPVLNFSALSPDLAEMASESLNSWRQLSQVEPALRNNTSNFAMAGHIFPALRMIGLEVSNLHRLESLPRSHDRRFVEVVVRAIVGNALVPAFGSKLDGRLRVLLAWGRPSAELLMSWADGDPSGESLLVVHFGTMSAQTRRDLAVKAAGRSAPVVVVDDAALAYLAAHGNRQMTATMNVLLPFSSVNPYIRQKRGVVAPEMFYGRDKERRSVIDPDGTQLVFGGRGLGKSALLNSAAQQFENQRHTVGERVALYLDLKAVGIRANSPISQDAIWDALHTALVRREVVAPVSKNAPDRPSRDLVEKGVQAWLDADPARRLLVLLDEADQFFEADMPDFSETTRLKALGQMNNGRVKVVFAGLHSVQRYAKTARNAPFGHMAQRPTVIGPLSPQHAADLLTRPLAALGYDFEDPDLVNRVLGYCSYQPFLLQIFASRLIEQMHFKRDAGLSRGIEPPYVITRGDVEAVETHADLRADIRAAFHETLNLDHRYGVIAHVLGYHAHEQGLDSRLTDKQLREECRSYWENGFAKLDVEGFRAYLQEMIGLGVLAPNNDGRGWHLRSANVLSMIGTRDDVETELFSAEERSVPDEFLALESRQELKDGKRSPLTAAQIDDLLGDHRNQVRVVLGSHATGVHLVPEAVHAAASVGNRFSLPPIGNRRQFEEQLVSGKPGEWRVVLDDLVSFAPHEQACLEALELAQTRTPVASGVTRSAVIVAGPEQMALWRHTFAQIDEASFRAPGALSLSTVTLRRYDLATLRVWSIEATMFTNEERRSELLRVTGGWPTLVEKAAQLVSGVGATPQNSSGMEEAEALRKLERGFETPGGAAAFVAQVGLVDQELCTAFDTMLDMIGSAGVSRADLEAAAELVVPDPSITVDCLIALQVFNVDRDGRFLPEPRLAACWPHR
ncbi:hypothetical protein JNUCC0626_08325 [Lentzea sp. JNUCC 0626]|uniref:hypothetical protein n=1 Tax=Lentzea sp. JNUCC 0626 TaxID=3367513 RepID=UPI003749D3E8